MQTVAIAAVVFACLAGGAFLGLLLRALLPDSHLGNDSKDVVKLAMGLVATMAALVLGLLTASAKSTFDTQNSEVQQSAAHIILLDRVLTRYGTETHDVREMIRKAVAFRVASTWPEDRAEGKGVRIEGTTPTVEAIEAAIGALTPQNDDQRSFKTRATALCETLIETRWLMFSQANSDLPLPFLVVLTFWLTVLFSSFAIFAPRNATVVITLLLCALAVSGSIFLILEMNQPLQGWIRISGAPMRYALSQLGQ